MTKPLRHIIALLLWMAALPALSQTTYEIRKYSLDDGLPSNLITCAEQDSRGLLWVGTWRGLCCFDGYEFIPFNNAGDPEERPECSRLHSIQFDRDNNVWCVTYNRRAHVFNTKACQWTDVSRLLEQKFKCGEFRVRNIYPLESGVVWITCYDEDELTFRIADANDLQGATNEYSHMEEKRNKAEQELWNKNRREKPDVSRVPGLATARKYLVDSQRNIWHLDNQLTRHTPREQKFIVTDATHKRNTRTIPEQPDIDGYQVYAALTDSKGRQWKGTKGGGLYLDGRRQDIQGNDVFDIFEDSKGRIWVACYDGGFNLLCDGKFANTDNRLKNYPKDKYAKVRHITETRDGVIFLSTADGIVCFSSKFSKPEDIKFHAYSQSLGGNVMQTLQASDGKVYISTMTGGLLTVTSGNPLKDNLVFKPVSETQSTDGIVLSMTEDSDGCLWLARESYLEKYNTRTGETVLFGKKDFGQEISFSEAQPCHTLCRGVSHTPNTGQSALSSQITFGTYGGTLSFSPKEIGKSRFTPRIFFSYLQYQGSPERKPILYAEELDISADRRNLTIFFSALDYQDNELIQYAYRIVEEDDIVDNLDNIDNIESSHWNYVGRAHCASFNNLPSGHLRLLVRSTNADGVWTDNIAEMRIYSHPTFWETPWAWLLYLIIIIVIVAVAVYIVQMRNRHRHEREEMERKLEALLVSLNTSPSDKEDPSAISHQPSASGQARTYALKEVEIDSEEKKMMERLMDYLNENISNSDLKINDLADAVNMSRSVFYDRLKNITKMSPVDFLRYLRIQRAKQMLTATDLSVSQIAYETGFSEPAYFTKVFKKSTGLSPLAYRKREAEKQGKVCGLQENE